MPKRPKGTIDIGNGVDIRYVSWKPDRELNPQYAEIPDEEKNGIIVGHFHDDGERCEGVVTFDTPTNRALNARSEYQRPLWQVVSLDPLHLEPSIAQKSGPDMTECLHGYIRNGRWESV